MSTARLLLATFRLWLPATRARRYSAAVATLLSFHAFEQLTPEQRAKVDDELIAIYKPFGLYPWWRFRADASPSAMASDRAIAMCRLGLPTSVAGVEWTRVLHSWHRECPAQLSQDFSPFHSVTDEAIDYLASRGMTLPPGKNYGQRWLLQARSRVASARPENDA